MMAENDIDNGKEKEHTIFVYRRDIASLQFIHEFVTARDSMFSLFKVPTRQYDPKRLNS
jgi:hypothetical protein